MPKIFVRLTSENEVDLDRLVGQLRLSGFSISLTRLDWHGSVVRAYGEITADWSHDRLLEIYCRDHGGRSDPDGNFCPECAVIRRSKGT